jgi:ATP-binding cassette, subfamily B, bacterial
VALLVAICNSASNVVSEAQSILVSDSIQEILHAKSVEVDLEYYENTKYYKMLHRAQQEGPSRPTQIVNGLLRAGRSCISLVAVFALMVSVNELVALLLCVAALPSALIQARYARKLYLWQRSCTRKERMAWYRHWLLTSDGYAKDGVIRKFRRLAQGRNGDHHKPPPLHGDQGGLHLLLERRQHRRERNSPEADGAGRRICQAV